MQHTLMKINGSKIIALAQNRVVYHLLFWVGYIAVFTSLLSTRYDLAESLKDVFLSALSYMFIVYLNLIYLIPNYLVKHKYLQYGLLLLLGLAISTPIIAGVGYLSFKDDEGFIENLNMQRYLMGTLINTFFMIGVTTGLKFVKDYFKEQQRTEALEKQSLHSELRFLKSQINPHFFFNTLNNLYSLTLKKSDAAPEVVLKLAEMMRYMLYDSNERMVSLNKELNYIKNYIELEKLRQGEQSKITLEIEGTPNGHMIAPLLFTPFLENCFKHGVNRSIGKSYVNIKLRLEGDELEFIAENSKSNKKPKNGKSHGIGLMNVNRRLELMYPATHKLSIEDAPEHYRTFLKINMQ
ncbi:MAG TPA: histidine kinase [Flavobacterium sp.]|nr:histidine kinase [Flavobacterium sp.]